MGELILVQLDEFQNLCIKRQKEASSKRLYMEPESKCKSGLKQLSFYPKRWNSKYKLA